ncbi:MAG: sulfotransferase family protein [Candidatus Saccharimonadales bacterium]
MSDLKVIGAGMWRTATYSLKLALEELTGEPCLHMSDLMPHRLGGQNSPRDLLARQWLEVVSGQKPAIWPELFRKYGSTVDWPSLMFWQDLMAAYPNAKILLSTRDAESWWQSVSQTVLKVIPSETTATTTWQKLILELFKQDFIGPSPSQQQAIEFYESHNALVRSTVPKERLIDWKFGDDWAPLCQALNLPVPAKPFPVTNSRAEFKRGNSLANN